MPPTPLPRRFRSFSLRSLMVLVAGLCAWLAYERSVAVSRREAIAFWTGSTGIAWRPAFPDNSYDPPSVNWLRRSLGDQAVAMVSISTEHEQAVFDQARLLFPEATIQWAMLRWSASGRSMQIVPLPSRDHSVYLSGTGPVIIEP